MISDASFEQYATATASDEDVEFVVDLSDSTFDVGNLQLNQLVDVTANPTYATPEVSHAKHCLRSVNKCAAMCFVRHWWCWRVLPKMMRRTMHRLLALMCHGWYAIMHD